MWGIVSTWRERAVGRGARLATAGAVLVSSTCGTTPTVARDSSAPGAPPPASTILFQENFEDASYAARGWYDLPAGAFTSVTTAEHVPGSTRALEVRFAAGQIYPQPAAGGRHAFAETESVYLSYWVKYSDNWVGSGKSYHPHEFELLTNLDSPHVGPAYTFLTVDIEHNYTPAGGVAVLSLQDSKNIDTSRLRQDLTNVTENRAVAGCNGAFDGVPGDCYASGNLWLNGKIWRSTDVVFSASAGPSYKGNWHRVEAYVKMNSIVGGKGQTDGIAQYWVDGRLVIDKRAVVFRTGAHANMKFNQFILSPYIGDGSPRAQTMWVDDLLVGTALPTGR